MTDVILISSTPAFSPAYALLDYVQASLRPFGLRTHLLSLIDLNLYALAERRAFDPSLSDMLAKVIGAQGIVLACPLVRGTYPGLLKLFLDYFPDQSWRSKVVLPFVIGADPHQALPVERAFTATLLALGVENSPSPVCFLADDVQLRGQKLLPLTKPLVQRVGLGIQMFVDQVQLK